MKKFIEDKLGIYPIRTKGNPDFVQKMRDTSNSRQFNWSSGGATIVLGSNDNALMVFLCGKSFRVARKIYHKYDRIRRWFARREYYYTDELTPYAVFRKADYEYGESMDDTVLVRYSGDPEDIDLHLEDEFLTNCHHAYDCCGAWYSRPYTHKTRKLGFGFYLITIHRYRNV